MRLVYVIFDSRKNVARDILKIERVLVCFVMFLAFHQVGTKGKLPLQRVLNKKKLSNK